MAEYDYKLVVCARCGNSGPAVLPRKIDGESFMLCRVCRSILKHLNNLKN